MPAWRSCGRGLLGWASRLGMAEWSMGGINGEAWGKGIVKARVGVKGGIFPPVPKTVSTSPLWARPTWLRQIQNETDERQKRQANKIIHVEKIIISPDWFFPQGKKPCHLVKRKTNCIYFVLGSLAQILAISPPQYRCDSLESKQQYSYVSPCLLSFGCGCGCFGLIFNHCLCQPSLCPCPE